jgi:predicted DNA-binding transcriptional regulator AlpA
LSDSRTPLSANEPVLSEFEVAKLLGVAVATLQTWRGRGEGPPYSRVSKAIVRYLRTRVVEWLDARTVAGGAPIREEESERQ